MRSRAISRAIELVMLLQTRRNVTSDYLARALKCSRRTVFRDIQLLRDAGFAVWYDETKCTFVIHGETATRPDLTEAEWKALLLAAGLSPIAQMAFYGRDVSNAMAKLMTLAPPPVQDTTNNLLRALESAFSHPRFAATAPPYLPQILEATSRRLCLRVVYRSEAPKSCDTKLSPFRVHIDSNGWVVRGRSSWHRSVIDLPLMHIRHAEILDETYSPPRHYLRTHEHDNADHRPHLKGTSRHVVGNPQVKRQLPNQAEGAMKARVQHSPLH